MKLLTVVGARPQFVKASVVSKAILDEPSITEVIVHTGQHFDANMSEVFFGELGIPKPKHKLDIHGGLHGEMTGRMLTALEQLILKEKPQRVLVYGDTNSTLAGALAAAKLNIPVSHVEAGLRSFNMGMPEEINRILTDQVCDQLFCPSKNAIENLKREGFGEKNVQIHNVGDVMHDSTLFYAKKDAQVTGFYPDGDIILATFHRAENTDDLSRLSSIVDSLNELNRSLAPVVVPLHPRTDAAIKKAGLVLDVHKIEPVGYIEMLSLIRKSKLVLTDSGGLQKEAFFLETPCLTMRDETEWVELIEIGANKLVGTRKNEILAFARSDFGKKTTVSEKPYGKGDASGRISELLAGTS